MPDTAKILRFPVPSLRPAERSVEEAAFLSEALLRIDASERTDFDWETLRDGNVCQSVLASLKNVLNSDPVRVGSEASSIHSALSRLPIRVGLFDEKDYFLGEFALLAAQATRLVGQFENSEHWLDISEASFCHTLNAPASILRVAYARLVVRYDMRRFSEVLSLLPSVAAGYERLGMAEDLVKANFLEAVTLKETGERSAAFERFSLLLEKLMPAQSVLRSLALTNIAEEHGQRGNHDLALHTYQKALSSLDPTQTSMASAQLKGSIGATFRVTGQLVPAIDCLRASIEEFVALGMLARVASLRIVLAEVLLAAGRDREAEWEILAALPAIEEQKMVAEGFAAVGLLKESVGRRRTDAGALRELNSALQGF